jgi:hypothetical protein
VYGDRFVVVTVDSTALPREVAPFENVTSPVAPLAPPVSMMPCRVTGDLTVILSGVANTSIKIGPGPVCTRVATDDVAL